jgi:hypothetical protein
MRKFQGQLRLAILPLGSQIFGTGAPSGWVRMGYDGSNYARPELEWTQRNFVCVQMMIEQRNFYDQERGVYIYTSLLLRDC